MVKIKRTSKVIKKQKNDFVLFKTWLKTLTSQQWAPARSNVKQHGGKNIWLETPFLTWRNPVFLTWPNCTVFTMLITFLTIFHNNKKKLVIFTNKKWHLNRQKDNKSNVTTIILFRNNFFRQKLSWGKVRSALKVNNLSLNLKYN